MVLNNLNENLLILGIEIVHSVQKTEILLKTQTNASGKGDQFVGKIEHFYLLSATVNASESVYGFSRHFIEKSVKCTRNCE